MKDEKGRVAVLFCILHFAFCILHFTLWPVVAHGDPTVGVALNHPVYRLIDRFEAKGWLRGWGNGTRPMSRMEVARALRQILDRAAKGERPTAAASGQIDSTKRERLTSAESGQIGRLKVEFGPELRAMGVEVPPASGSLFRRLGAGGHLGAWEGAEGYVSIDALLRQQFIASDDGARTSLTQVGGFVEGTAGRLVGFRVRHWEARQQGNRAIRSHADIIGGRVEFLEVKGKLGDFREATGQVVVGTPWFDVAMGKDFESWGPSFTGSLFLSDNAPSFPFVKLRARYGRVKFVHLMGFLRSGLLDTARTREDNGHLRTFERRKYLSAHRVEVGITSRITIGAQEILIYGDRGVEFAYAIPASFLFATQTFLGDKDNTALGLDVDFRLVRNLKVYGALFLDDLSKFQGPNAFSNKFAVQAGFLWVDPGGLRDTEVRGEFVRVEPWVYTHLFNINRYQHDEMLLGHPLGPNSDGIYGEVLHRFTGALSFTLSASRERHGSNPVLMDGTVMNVGGDPDLGQRPGDDVRTKQFLAGIREGRTRFGCKATFEPVLDLFLEAGYRRLIFQGSGLNPKRHEWTATMSYNFY